MSLVFPRALAGRLDISDDLRANVEVNAARTFGAEQRQISIDEVRQLSSLTLRLESLSASKTLVTAKVKSKAPGETEERAVRVVAPAAHLGPSIQDDVTDEELCVIIESLATRIENSLSTLVSLTYSGALLIPVSQTTRRLCACTRGFATRRWNRSKTFATRTAAHDEHGAVIMLYFALHTHLGVYWALSHDALSIILVIILVSSSMPSIVVRNLPTPA